MEIHDRSAASRRVLAAGDVVGRRYRLERFLARGGMGSVWLATHLELAGPVAIKFLEGLRGHAREEIERMADRFRFEAQVSARLSADTEHVVSVRDAGLHAGAPYLVMEYIPGPSLQGWFDEGGPVEPSRLLPVLDAIAEALDVAHRMGVVHRDVKPSNVLLGPPAGAAGGCRAKLSDFGVAKLSPEGGMGLLAPKATTDGSIVGSAAYFSPERVKAATPSAHASPEVDRWALAVVAYQGLTGQRPFDGDAVPELVLAILHQPPPPPSTMVPLLPTALDAVFRRALSLDPAERYRTCRAFVAALHAGLADEAPGLQVAGPATAKSAKKAAGRRLAVAVAVALVVVGGASLSLLASQPPPLGSQAAGPSAGPSAGPTTPSTTPSTTPAEPPPSASPSPARPSPLPAKVPPRRRQPPATPPKPASAPGETDPSNVH